MVRNKNIQAPSVKQRMNSRPRGFPCLGCLGIIFQHLSSILSSRLPHIMAGLWSESVTEDTLNQCHTAPHQGSCWSGLSNEILMKRGGDKEINVLSGFKIFLPRVSLGGWERTNTSWPVTRRDGGQRALSRFRES